MERRLDVSLQFAGVRYAMQLDDLFVRRASLKSFILEPDSVSQIGFSDESQQLCVMSILGTDVSYLSSSVAPADGAAGSRRAWQAASCMVLYLPIASSH